MTDTAFPTLTRSNTIAQNTEPNPEPGQMTEPEEVPVFTPPPIKPESETEIRIEGVPDKWQTAAKVATRSSVKVNGESGFIVHYDPEKKLAYVLTTQDVVDQGSDDGKIAIVTADGNAVVGTVHTESDNFNRADFFLGSNLALVTFSVDQEPEVVVLQTAAPNLGEPLLVSAHTNQPNKNESVFTPRSMGNEIALLETTVIRNLSPGNIQTERNIIGNGGLVLPERHASSSRGGPVFNTRGEIVAIVMEELDLGTHSRQRINGDRVEIEGGSVAIGAYHILQFLLNTAALEALTN